MQSPWEDDLRVALGQIPRPVRAELLRPLRLQPEALDEEIARRESDPRTRGSETLRQLRDEPVARLTVSKVMERGNPSV